MADVYRTGKVLIINGVVTPAGTIVANAQTTFMHLAAMVSANDLIHVTTSVTETNKTSQFIPTADEINWSKAFTGPEPKAPTPLVSQIPLVWNGDCFPAGASTLSPVWLQTYRSAPTLTAVSTVTAVGVKL